MAHAWNACWVNALGGSNPPFSAGSAPASTDAGAFFFSGPKEISRSGSYVGFMTGYVAGSSAKFTDVFPGRRLPAGNHGLAGSWPCMSGVHRTAGVWSHGMSRQDTALSAASWSQSIG